MASTVAGQAAPPGKKKYFGLDRNQLIIAGAVGLGALGYILWRRYRAKQAAASASAAAPPATECVDANNNPVPCNPDAAGELGALQSELESALAAGAGGTPIGGTTGGTIGGSDGSGGTASGGGTGTASGGGTTTITGRLSAPTGIQIPIRGKTGVRLTWSPVAGAQYYVAQCKKGGANGQVVNGPFRVSTPVANFGGLVTQTAYTALIWPGDAADPGGPGSAQPHVEFPFSTA